MVAERACKLAGYSAESKDFPLAVAMVGWTVGLKAESRETMSAGTTAAKKVEKKVV
jgi:hypothetical protein